MIRPMLNPILFLFFSLMMLSSCKNDFTGNPKANLPPETHTVVDTIIRVGGDRFHSLVTINWWGDDADGFVKGFEFTFDSVINTSTVWTYTTKPDSDFLLATPYGQDTADFSFWVRAIDNNQIADPTPAHLKYPVKNSPPTIQFISGANNPLQTFPIVKFLWKAADPDGDENLNHIELVWNDTTQAAYSLDITSTAATFEATNLSVLNPLCNVYTNNSLNALTQTIDGMVLNDTNILYIRAVDDAGAHSNFIGSYKIYIKQPHGNLLLVDGYGNGNSSIENFYVTQLQSAGVTTFDTLKIFQQSSGSYTQLAPDNLTQSRIFKLFDKIIWFSNDAANSLGIGQRCLNDFFNNNGKLLMSCYISGTFDEQSTFLDFTPAQSLIVLQDSTLLLADTSTVISTSGSYPDLKCTQYIGTVRPFNLQLGASAMYNANIIAKNNITLVTGPWGGASTVIARKTNSSSQTNFVFSTLELQKLNGNNNMGQFFQQLIQTDFNW